jgi:exopolyphosphatase/guanosine-5'-triphosphate,3'-diphosphate pyrophosphatase
LNSAIIDVGSNTVHLCVFDFRDGMIETVFSRKETVGLAGYIHNHKLEFDGIRQVCETLRSFRSLALKFVPEDSIHVFATASLRSITNKDHALGVIRSETGLLPETLTGDEEAYLDFVGVAHATKLSEGFLIDVGGGSTEFVRFAGGAPEKKTVLPIGCLALYSKHMRGPVVSKSERKAMRREIHELFDAFEWNGAQCATLIGVGGSARTALRLSKALLGVDENSAAFPAENVHILRKMFEDGSPEAFRALYKIAPDRVLTVCPGLLILEEAVKRLNCDGIYISKYGVREGFYIDRVLKLVTNERMDASTKPE